MKPRIIAGIDIGSNGSLALLTDLGELVDVADMPTLDSGPACRPWVNPALLATLLRQWNPTEAYVEQIGPRLGDRPSGAFSFGAARATVEAVLACCGIPFRSIQPAVWKRAVSIPAGKGMKDLARARAIERWPDRADLFARVKDHDRAAACLIGWVGLLRERAGR